MTLDTTAIIPSRAKLGANVTIGPHVILTDYVTLETGCTVEAGVIFAGTGPRRTVVRSGVCVSAGAVIGSGVELGWGCRVLPGSVVHTSVPANAVVQGNPAQIIGYTEDFSRATDDARGTITDQSAIAGSERSVVGLGVGAAALHKMLRVADLRGSLTVGEVAKDLPFAPQRYFVVFDVPSEELRGEHAHHHCEQFLICIRGSCRALLDDGRDRREVILDRPELGLYMPPMIWGTQYRYTRDAVLLVLASLAYDPGDYIRTYDAFMTQVRNAAK